MAMSGMQGNQKPIDKTALLCHTWFMEDAEQNGYNNPRMDRIELALEKLISGHQKIVDAQEAFTEEHKQLLTAQILLTGRMDKLAESQIAADGRITILVGMMDTFIRERGDAR